MVKDRIKIKKVPEGKQIWYNKQYVATYVHHVGGVFETLLEHAHMDDSDTLEMILEERIENGKAKNEDCTDVHTEMKLLFGYKFCSMCGEKL